MKYFNPILNVFLYELYMKYFNPILNGVLYELYMIHLNLSRSPILPWSKTSYFLPIDYQVYGIKCTRGTH